MLIIALSGPDGTGKTSCARILSRILSRRGFNTKCVWIKHVHTVAYILVKLLEIINRKHVVRSHSGTFVTHSMASRLWGWIELIGIVPLVLKIYVSALISKYIENESTVFISDGLPSSCDYLLSCSKEGLPVRRDHILPSIQGHEGVVDEINDNYST